MAFGAKSKKYHMEIFH
uniref:Uncharacterized protein n=1 Tax=Rhizophora mucronata TaxID=61149 RepID=A0A2P2QQ70_RHIMU